MQGSFSPSFRFKKFQLTTNPTAGYVMTSDAYGFATWQAGSGGSVYEKTIYVQGAPYTGPTAAQDAYNAATAYATSLGAPVVMFIGIGESSDFGDITLSAGWDSNVLIAGLGSDLSKLGDIIATSANDGFSIEIRLGNISLGTIDTSSTDATDTFTAGSVELYFQGPTYIQSITASNPDSDASAPTISLFGIATTSNAYVDGVLVNQIETICKGDTGPLDLPNGIMINNIVSTPINGNGSLITIRDYSTIGSLSVASSTAANTSNVVIGSHCKISSFDNSAVGGNTGTVNIGDYSFSEILIAEALGVCGAITLSNSVINGIYATVAPIVKAYGCKFTAKLFSIAASSAFSYCEFSTSSGGNDCVADINGNGAQFRNCEFTPNGAGKSINATVARTIVGFNLITKNGVGANISYSESNNVVTPTVTLINV